MTDKKRNSSQAICGFDRHKMELAAVVSCCKNLLQAIDTAEFDYNLRSHLQMNIHGNLCTEETGGCLCRASTPPGKSPHDLTPSS